MAETKKDTRLEKVTLLFRWKDFQREFQFTEVRVCGGTSVVSLNLVFEYVMNMKKWVIFNDPRMGSDYVFGRKNSEDYRASSSPCSIGCEADILYNFIHNLGIRADYKCDIIAAFHGKGEQPERFINGEAVMKECKSMASRWIFKGAWFSRTKFAYDSFYFQLIYESCHRLNTLSNKPTPLEIVLDRKELGF